MILKNKESNFDRFNRMETPRARTQSNRCPNLRVHEKSLTLVQRYAGQFLKSFLNGPDIKNSTCLF